MTVISQNSQEPAAPSRRWRFGTAVLDERSLELTLSGEPVELDRKLLQMLVHLLERAGEVVTKDELLEQVWPGRVIADATLTKSMSRLRDALQDKDQLLIKTQHGYGYRLVAPVRVETLDKPAPKLGLVAGDHPPQRSQWSLVERLGSGGHGELWLARHDKTREVRVYKFAIDEASLSSLKREITLNRLLNDSLHEKASVFVRLLDWNLEQPPFFIETEYLPAGSLEQWVDRQGGCAQIPEELRLELAAQIAEALGLAHSVGVLHKDLKPGNVLIDAAAAQAAPNLGAVSIKLCDFGSGGVQDRARLADGNITQLGFTTTVGLSADSGGTPMYLAPEMLRGQSASVQADLYSFGVLLYQLVAGDLTNPLAAGWERDITDELLREDVAALVDGDPKRRLGDAAEVARRLRTLSSRREERARLRRNEQEAERLREALQHSRVRRQWSLALAGVFGLGLLIAGVLLVQVQQAREEAQAQTRRAESEAATAATVNEFLLEDLLGQASPLDSGRVDLKVREVLDLAAGSAARRFAKEPDRERAIRLAVGKAYLQLGDYSKSETELRAALALTRDSEPQQRAAVDLQLGILLRYVDRIPEARAATSRAATHGDVETRLMAAATLAFFKSIADDQDATAVQELLALRPQFEARLGAGHRGMDWLLEGLTGAYAANGQFKEAAEVAREHATRLRERYGEDDPRGIHAQSNFGAALILSEQFGEGVQVLEALLPRVRAALGGQHMDTLQTARYLADAYSETSRIEEALALLEPTYQTLRSRYGDEYSDTLRVQNDLALLYGQHGDFGRQIAMLEKQSEIVNRKFGESDDEALTITSNLALAYADVGNFVKAEAIQAHALEVARRSRPEHWQVGAIAASRASMLGQLDRFEESEALFEEAIQHLTKTLSEDHSRVVTARENRDAMRERRQGAAQDRRS